jgi:aquaporin Z
MSQDNPDKATALPEPEPGEAIAAAGTPEPEEPTVAADEPAAAATVPVVPEQPAVPALPEEPDVLALPAELAELDDEDVDAYVIPAGSVVVTGPSLFAKLGAEAFGTFTLVLVGLGIALYMTISGVGGALGVGLGFGIAVLAAAVAVGHISGGHFNPAVTLGAAIGGRTAWKDVIPYWLAQLVGGIFAAAILFITIPEKLPNLLAPDTGATAKSFFSGVANGYGAHSPLSVASTGQVSFTQVTALLIEVVVTAVFVGVILGATDRRATRVQAPVAIGLALAVLILVALPITNGSLNPARSTAAAIFSDSWALGQLWLFWVAPLVGAALAGLVYRAFAAEPPEDNLLEEDEAFITTEDTLVVTER